VNPALKHFAERALIGCGVERFASRRVRGRTLVLAYHNVVPEGDRASGDSSLHLTQRDFARQLDTLARSHDVIPIEEIMSDTPASYRPRVVITFDDAYAGAVSVGIAELTKRGMPATIFVTPALLESVPWWDILAQADGTVPDALRRRALDDMRGEGEAILRSAHATSPVPGSASALPRIATESQLTAIASSPGITLGSHTWSHPNLCAQTDTELEAELLRPLAWLRSRFASVVPWVSYPYGRFNEAVQRAAAKAGYRGAFRIDGGWLPGRARQPYAIPRLNIPSGLSIDGFRLRLAGL
jgi:poly-beta-1,6-N-acetyl-D-glucosamine N-deacetylase